MTELRQNWVSAYVQAALRIALTSTPLSYAVSMVKDLTQARPQPPIADPKPPFATPPATGEERRNG